MTIRLRLTILYAGLLALALILFSTLLYGILRWSFVKAADETLQSIAAKVAFYYQYNGMLPQLDSLSDRSTFVQVRTANSVIDQSLNFKGLFPLPEAARRGEPAFTYQIDANGESYRLYTLPILRDDRPLFYVQVASPLRMLNIATGLLRWPLVAGTLLFMGLAAIGSWWLARRAIAPIEQIARAARIVGESSDLSLRVPSSGADDEVGLLVRTFNDMLDQLQGLYGRLAAAVDAQRRFVADASHELRTPLTIIRGNIEYMQKIQQFDLDALNDMAAEAARMTQLIEELLTMARADSGQAPDLQPLALGPMVRESCRKAMALPHEVEFRTELPEALDRVMVMGNAEWLMRALVILLDNAFKYTPVGMVTVRAGRQGDGVVVQVSDTGVGIAKEDLAHIFERFYRADRARSRGGAGLGLAIAQWIAGVHGGTLVAESEPGKGSTFSLWLPVFRGLNS